MKKRKKDTFVIYLKVNSEEVYAVYKASLKRVLIEINKLRNISRRYETATLYRAAVEGECVSAGKLVCEFQMLPKYYSRSKDELYF